MGNYKVIIKHKAFKKCLQRTTLLNWKPILNPIVIKSIKSNIASIKIDLIKDAFKKGLIIYEWFVTYYKKEEQVFGRIYGKLKKCRGRGKTCLNCINKLRCLTKDENEGSSHIVSDFKPLYEKEGIQTVQMKQKKDLLLAKKLIIS